MNYELTRVDSEKILVEPFHVDFMGNIFLGVLGNHLLNVAGKHSQRRGWGIGALNETRHTWVLSRLCIELEEMPQQYETMEIETWVEGVMKLFTNRNFAILRPDGTAYGYARSVWAMIDMETRKPCDLLSLYDGDILRYVVAPEEKACPIEGHGRFRFRDAQLQRTIDTYYSDVDINGHINSIKYIEHILDLFPRERFASKRLQRFEIAYKTESYMGDRLSFYTQVVNEDEVDVEVRKSPANGSNGLCSDGREQPSPSEGKNEGEIVCQAKLRFAGREKGI